MSEVRRQHILDLFSSRNVTPFAILTIQLISAVILTILYSNICQTVSAFLFPKNSIYCYKSGGFDQIKCISPLCFCFNRFYCNSVWQPRKTASKANIWLNNLKCYYARQKKSCNHWLFCECFTKRHHSWNW